MRVLTAFLARRFGLVPRSELLERETQLVAAWQVIDEERALVRSLRHVLQENEKYLIELHTEQMLRRRCGP